MKHIVDIGDLDALYVEHDTPIPKTTRDKPKPSAAPLNPPAAPSKEKEIPTKNVSSTDVLVHGGGRTLPNTPALPSTPSAPVAPLAPVTPATPVVPTRPYASAEQESPVVPWIVGGLALVLAAAIGWAIVHHPPRPKPAPPGRLVRAPNDMRGV